MPRAKANAIQNLLSSVILPLLSTLLLPVSLAAVAACVILDLYKSRSESKIRSKVKDVKGKKNGMGCVIISGGRMSKGLT
jgi:hypothetical protein